MAAGTKANHPFSGALDSLELLVEKLYSLCYPVKVQIEDTNFSIAQSQSMPQEHTEIKPEEPASHSAIQRPLIIESEKCASQRSINEANVQISESPISPPSVPLTAMQRPLVFDGSSQMTEGFVLASEGTLEMCSSEISPVQRENLERDARIEDEEIKNGDAKISTVDIKPKSSGFSWMPSFSKQHSTGKEEKSAEIHTNKEPESKENKKIKDAEPHIKKDGMKKFFDNLLHDTSTDTKNKPIIHDDHHDSEDVGKISVTTTSELPKEGDSAIKETSKESKFNMKKMFDSLKHDTTEKKDTDLGSSQSETKSKGKISPTQELPKEKVSKDVSKDSKFNMKICLTHLNMILLIKKVVALDVSPSEINSKEITSTLNEPSKDTAAKKLLPKILNLQ
ncbi:DH domain-containing protein [Caerostris extrusa]|uniref:DH domain-containing protein n=1 Tax=Caerostris extrusa TaxID=172846 RepID=A0AAV4NQP0_CAEEX|nr:DH domain-containing protein [Caerostris extrusa]